jgi:hypothetical protein
MRAHSFTLVAAAMLRVGLLPFAPSHGASMTVPVGGSIQAAIDAASPGDTVYLGPGEYFENIRMKERVALVGSGPNLTVIRSISRRETSVIRMGDAAKVTGLTIADGVRGIAVSCDDVAICECVLTANEIGLSLVSAENFLVQGCSFLGNKTGIQIDSSHGFISDCDIHGNQAGILCGDAASCEISRCDISCNLWGLDVCNVFPQWGLVVVNSLLRGNGFAVRSYATRNPVLVNCTLWGNIFGVAGHPDGPGHVAVGNSIIWASEQAPVDVRLGSVEILYSNVEGGWPGDGNIEAEPQFVDPWALNFRLRPGSACIDAGDNASPYLPDTDIDGMPRVAYGGRSPTVDMGAYEYYINEVEPGPGADESALTWSSLGDKTYSIFYTRDLLTWHLADDRVPSAGNMTTSWIDDGTLTGIPPSLAPRRFYRILENP